MSSALGIVTILAVAAGYEAARYITIWSPHTRFITTRCPA